MTWYPDHPGGIMTCDAPGCTRTRRNYCSPTERDQWVAYQEGNTTRDLCPDHRNGRKSSPAWLTENGQEMSREKELEIVNNATQGPWTLTPTGVVAEDGAFLAFAQLDANNKFIATFNPARVRELLDENYEVTRLLAERDLKLNYANKSIHRLESRLAAVERIADAIEEHDAPFEAFPTAQWVRKAARGE